MSQTITGGDVAENLSKEKEVFGRINEMRKALNQTYDTNADFSTTGNNALTVAWTSPAMPLNGIWHATIAVEGYSSAGTGSLAYTMLVGLENIAGTLITIGGSSVTVMQRRDDVTLDSVLSINGQTLQVKVKDNANAMKWRIHVSILEGVK